MRCEHTAALVTEYLDDTLSLRQRNMLDAHRLQCLECEAALSVALATMTHLQRWREQPVPAWTRPRASAEVDARRASPTPKAALWQWWQWAPLVTSFLLAFAVMLNVQFSATEDGFAIRLGSTSSASLTDVEARLAVFEAQQQLAMQTLTTNLAQQQSADNARLMDAVIDSVVGQFGDSTARSLEQVIAYFESQRQQDLQLLRTSYQQLADSDYATIRSVEQLASLVQRGQP